MVPKKGTLAYRCDVITRTLGASVGAKAAEKISVTYHFVIWSMKVFVSIRFHVVSTKSMLADFFVFFGPPLRPNASNLTRQKSLFANGF